MGRDRKWVGPSLFNKHNSSVSTSTGICGKRLQLMLSWQPSDPMTLLSVGAVPRSLGTSSKREGEMGVGGREGDEVGCKERL